MKARQEEKFMSIDDLKIRSKVGDSVTELLRQFGCLEGMSQSNQLSLFGKMKYLERKFRVFLNYRL